MRICVYALKRYRLFHFNFNKTPQGEEADMTMDISGFRAPHLGKRVVPEYLRREAPAKKASAPAPKVMSTEERVVHFFRWARNGATSQQLEGLARDLGITENMEVRRTLRRMQPLTTGQKVGRFFALASEDDAKAVDLLHQAKRDEILHIRIVRDKIADVEERSLRPKKYGLREAILAAGKFVPPTEVAVKKEDRPTNVGNPRGKGPGGSKPGQSSNPETAAKRARKAAQRK